MSDICTPGGECCDGDDCCWIPASRRGRTTPPAPRGPVNSYWRCLTPSS